MDLAARARVGYLRRLSRRAILRQIAGARDVAFIRLVGNIGDELIWAGTRQLLVDVPYREVFVGDVGSDAGGDLALVAGGGGWCRPFHGLVPYELPRVEERFRRVVVLPSSYDTTVEVVREALEGSNAMFFAREAESLRQVSDLTAAELAVDCAFHFDFRPYRRPGTGTLLAYRVDTESVRGWIPEDNDDISLTCTSLDQWLHTIARHAVVHTDRAHVMLAAAMLGKRVFWSPSSYHKLPGIAGWSLRGLVEHAPNEPLPVGASA